MLSLLGYRLTGIRDRNEGVLRTYMQQLAATKMPEFKAVQMLFSDDFPREIFRCFRENRLVVSALDVNRDRGDRLKTCPVQYFRETREFLTGTMQIAMRCGATVVPTFVVSRPNYYYRIVIEPAIYVPETPGATVGAPPAAADTVGAAASAAAGAPALPLVMQRYADAIAAHIRAYPDHLSRA